MPEQIAKACEKCGKAINEPGNTSFYHAACNPRPQQRADYDKFRDKQPYRHLYHTAAWRRLRLRVLAEQPICDACNRAAATEVDHKNDHKGNWLLFYSRENVHGLCKPCHDKKTGQEHGFGTPSTPAPGGIPQQVMGVPITPVPTTTSVPSPAPGKPKATVMGIPFHPTTIAVEPEKVDTTKVLTQIVGPPLRLRVDPAHQHFPDGQVAFKKEYSRYYRKAGDFWLITPEDFKP